MSDIQFKFKKGDKEVEVSLKDVNTRYGDMVLIQAFKFLDLDTDVEKMLETYKKTGQAFEEFFSSINNESNYEDEGRINESEENENHIEENSQMKEAQEEIAVTDEVVQKISQAINGDDNDDDYDDNPDFYTTGIKYKEGSTPHYRCHYWCPSCKDSGNHYIREGTFKVNCYKCGCSMKVEVADKENGFPNRDDFGNFYIAKKRTF